MTANRGGLPPMMLQPEDVTALLRQCAAEDDKPTRARFQALIAVWYRGGLTVGESVALRLDDVNVENGTLRVGSAGDLRHRTVGVDEGAVILIRRWLKIRRSLNVPGDFTFCNYLKNPGKPMATNGTRGRLRDLARAAGVGGKRGAHPQAFRYLLASELMVEGWPLPYIQAHLGITTLQGMSNFMKHLDVPAPSDAEVSAVARTRLWRAP